RRGPARLSAQLCALRKSGKGEMKVLVIGSGGREHALCWKLTGEGHEVFGAPGNPGIASLGECFDLSPMDFGAVLEVCSELRPDLVVVGPEDPLIAGLADELRQNEIDVFGPGRDGALLEGSKAYSKALMYEAGVPTARSGA